ncbi:zf-TFIIB domain-containing protein [Pseudoalteromonas piscicida]|uniref:Transcription factor zinc-finger domain-containing protein n=1 Tax=Pseudoalteromonas piscicida TaxID=43662 RepID=A0A2A5JSA3_PSEO7|nr:zf-TFIIB domain-containing protein [Pseudoalteromonas piscicida]PCK32267.1 hypothetical protein CEX98_08020 [Pseudoalteromonas piscicida]
MNCLCDNTSPMIYTEAEGHCGYQCSTCDMLWLPRKFVESIQHTYRFSYTDFLAARTPAEEMTAQSCPDDGNQLKGYTLASAAFRECTCCAGVWFEAGELQSLLQNYPRISTEVDALNKLDFLNFINFLS